MPLNKTILNLFVLLVCLFINVCGAQETKPQPIEKEKQPLRDLNAYFPFQPPSTIKQWEIRKSELRENLRVALGLWPQPTKHDLNPVVHGQIEKQGYTIHKVYFESMPGFFVTGNLYKPTEIRGTVPGVLSPHGHFADGRFHKSTEEEIDREIDSGAEQFRDNARSVMQARCANLARMGCVVFHYDMIGYADSKQISFELAHQFATQRPDLNQPNHWGLFSPQAESNLQSVMGLQTWNSIRALDFLCTLPEVDQQRLAVTGASGGGTQTFLLCAIDERPAVAFPAVMVSTAMQGGCTCENCCYLRTNTGNVELAALFAPKPLGLTAADDWTKEMATKGFPELQALYQMYEKPDNVQLTPRLEFGHNFNQVSREAMYLWFKTHFGLTAPAKETEIEYVEPAELSVYDDQHPAPPSMVGGEEFEISLLKAMKAASDKQLDDILLNRKPASSDFDDTIGAFVETATAASDNEVDVAEKIAVRSVENTDWNVIEKVESHDFTGFNYQVRTLKHRDPRGTVWLIDTAGVDVLKKKSPHENLVKRLLEQRLNVTAFENSRFDGVQRKQSARVDNERESLSYTLGYNPPQLTSRAIAWQTICERTEYESEQPFFILALDESALEVAFNALALRNHPNLRGIIIDTQGFRFQDISDIRDPNLVPGAAKYFDLPGLLALAAPQPMLIFGENEQSTAIIRQAYAAAERSDLLELALSTPSSEQDKNAATAKIIDWIELQLTLSDE